MTAPLWPIGEWANCPLCNELIYNSGASWRGHFTVSHVDERPIQPWEWDAFVEGMGDDA